MSKDRVSGLPSVGPAPETEMSEEMLASRSPFQTALLAAGRADALPPGRKQQLFRNLSIAIGAPDVLGEGQGLSEPGQVPDQSALGGSQADVAGRAALKAMTKVAGVDGLAAKLVGGVAITGALVWGGWQAAVGSKPATAPVAVATVVAEAAEGSAAETKPSPPEPAGGAGGRAAAETTGGSTSSGSTVGLAGPSDEAAADSAKGVRARTKASESDSLARELSLIDNARAALLRGEPAVALRTLQTYRSQFPRGALQAEATVQRVEALMAIGDRASASTIGGAFLKRHPDSPYSRRISSLLGSGREPQVDGARKSK